MLLFIVSCATTLTRKHIYPTLGDSILYINSSNVCISCNLESQKYSGLTGQPHWAQVTGVNMAHSQEISLGLKNSRTVQLHDESEMINSYKTLV